MANRMVRPVRREGTSGGRELAGEAAGEAGAPGLHGGRAAGSFRSAGGGGLGRVRGLGRP